MSSPKTFRIRLKVLDGKPRERNKLKGQLVPHVDVIDAKNGIEFVVCAVKEAHLDQVRAKLSTAGLEEVPGGDTEVSPPAPSDNTQGNRRGGQPQPSGAQSEATPSNAPKLRDKPYGFIPLPDELTTAAPVWYDGSENV